MQINEFIELKIFQWNKVNNDNKTQEDYKYFLDVNNLYDRQEQILENKNLFQVHERLSPFCCWSDYCEDIFFLSHIHKTIQPREKKSYTRQFHDKYTTPEAETETEEPEFMNLIDCSDDFEEMIGSSEHFTDSDDYQLPQINTQLASAFVDKVMEDIEEVELEEPESEFLQELKRYNYSWYCIYKVMNDLKNHNGHVQLSMKKITRKALELVDSEMAELPASQFYKALDLFVEKGLVEVIKSGKGGCARRYKML